VWIGLGKRLPEEQLHIALAVLALDVAEWPELRVTEREGQASPIRKMVRGK